MEISSLDQKIELITYLADSKLYNLLDKLDESKKLFIQLQTQYGDDFISNFDKNLATFFCGKNPKNIQKTRIYGEQHKYHSQTWLEEEYTIAKQMIKDGKTIPQISEYLGRTEYSIECVLLKFNLITATVNYDVNTTYYIKCDGDTKSLTLYQLKKILSLLDKDNITITEIAEKINVQKFNTPIHNFSVDELETRLLSLGLIELE